MADGLVFEGGSLDGGADLRDVVYDCVGRVADAANGCAVKVLAADGDTGDDISEGRAVLGDGVLQSSELILESFGCAGGPEAEEKRRLRLDGGRDGRDGRVGCSTLNHSEQPHACEATVGVGKLLGSLHLVGKVDLLLGRTGSKSATGVESLVALLRSIGRRKGGPESQNKSEELHVNRKCDGTTD